MIGQTSAGELRVDAGHQRGGTEALRPRPCVLEELVAALSVAWRAATLEGADQVDLESGHVEQDALFEQE